MFLVCSVHNSTGAGWSAGITSLCTVALIAVERMFVVCKPLGQITFQKKHALGGIALSWLWSLTWNLPPLFGWGRYELEGVGTSCAPDWHNRDPHNVSYILAYFTVCFAVPLAIILGSYAKLMWTLHQVRENVLTFLKDISCIPSLSVSQVSKMACLEDGAVAKGELKVAFMVIVMMLAFLVSWLPYAGLAMLVVHNPDVEVDPLVGSVPVYLAKSSTVFNPVIYIYLNKQVGSRRGRAWFWGRVSIQWRDRKVQRLA